MRYSSPESGGRLNSKWCSFRRSRITRHCACEWNMHWNTGIIFVLHYSSKVLCPIRLRWDWLVFILWSFDNEANDVEMMLSIQKFRRTTYRLGHSRILSVQHFFNFWEGTQEQGWTQSRYNVCHTCQSIQMAMFSFTNLQFQWFWSKHVHVRVRITLVYHKTSNRRKKKLNKNKNPDLYTVQTRIILKLRFGYAVQ